MRIFTPIGKIHTFINPPSIASSLHRLPVLIRRSPRILFSVKASRSRISTIRQSRHIQSTPCSKMSQKPFSNTEVPSDKPAEPYKATNKTEPELKEKVEDLVNFITSCKFGMMTTRIESSGLLTSRCMALAATVSFRAHSSSIACSQR